MQRWFTIQSQTQNKIGEKKKTQNKIYLYHKKYTNEFNNDEILHMYDFFGLINNFVFF